MSNHLVIKSKINSFNKTITVSGDKSISIRWVLFSSLANGISKAKNLLKSEDVLAALKAVKVLGIKSKFEGDVCKIFGKGINGYNYKKKQIIDAENSGTLSRLILGLLIDSPNPIKLIGDKSLSRRDFRRISEPLTKFGAKFKLKNNKSLPLTILGSSKLNGIVYEEKKGSAQCKSSVIFAGMKSNGETLIKAKKSRNHTEIFCKNLNLPIKIKVKKYYDEIKINKVNNIKPLNYKIPSDISSSAFFIALTALTRNSKLLIKNVNINPSRIGVIKIFNKMGINVIFQNERIYNGEKIADIKVESPVEIKPINCPSNLNSGAIDEFLIIFLVAAKAKGISYFRDLEELNQKESPRLKWGSEILNNIGIKNIVTNKSIKIFGNPDIEINRKIIVQNYLKDHRVFMTSVIAALTFGGNWKIADKDCFKTSFPSFLKIINSLKK